MREWPFIIKVRILFNYVVNWYNILNSVKISKCLDYFLLFVYFCLVCSVNVCLLTVTVSLQNHS